MQCVRYEGEGEGGSENLVLRGFVRCALRQWWPSYIAILITKDKYSFCFQEKSYRTKTATIGDNSQLDSLPDLHVALESGPDGIPAPQPSRTFFEYPTCPVLKIENDWVISNSFQ